MPPEARRGFLGLEGLGLTPLLVVLPFLTTRIGIARGTPFEIKFIQKVRRPDKNTGDRIIRDGGALAAVINGVNYLFRDYRTRWSQKNEKRKSGFAMVYRGGKFVRVEREGGEYIKMEGGVPYKVGGERAILELEGGKIRVLYEQEPLEQ